MSGLEPTEEQLDAIHDVTLAEDKKQATALFALIRDWALEAAAQRCEAHQGHGLFFGRLIRDLKGTP